MEKNNSIIADTSALLSLLLPEDSNHQKAQAITNNQYKISSYFYIPADVFTETLNTLGKKFGHRNAVRSSEYLLDQKHFHILESHHDIRINALEKLKKLPSSVSYTDCIVMAVADHLETNIIFGFDDVFQQEGYQLP